MSRPVNIQDSITINPTGSTGSSNLTASNISNAYANASSTSYATLTLNTSSTGYIYFTFPAPSGIPAGATINSVTGTVKVRVSNTSRVTNTVCQLYYNTTAKGSNYTFASTSTSNTVSMTNTGSWTLSQLNNLRLRIGGTGSSSTSTKAIYFYGANIVINYTFQTTEYTVAASSNVDDVDVSPATQTPYASETAEIRIDASSIDDIEVTDNDIDVTSQLVRHNNSSGTQTFTAIPSSFDSTNSSYSSIYNNNNPENGLTNASSSTRCCAYSNDGSVGLESYLYYNFDCSSIPANAIIQSVTAVVAASCYSSGSYFSTRELQFCVGTSPKGTAVTVTGNGSTAANHNVNGGTTWTRAELNNLKMRFKVVRSQTGDASFSFFGADLTITYTLPQENPYYWTYTLTNISADHIIIINQKGAYIPPEEDPEETYWSLNISSINATTDPKNGTTRVIEGTGQTVTIYPTDPQLTLALDNGVDITNQLVGGVPTNTYTITTQVSGATYGFNLNSGTGYYVSTNNGVAKSASVARINMDFESDCLVTIQYINYAEANYDYGMFGKIDTAVATDGLTASSNSSSPSDSTSNYELAMASNSSSAQTISYTVPAGQHFIDVKYGKDDATDSNNDSLQWKVLSVEATGVSGNYTYTLSNITQSHSLVFVFGNVDYYFITSTGSNCRVFPDGQTVKLEGDSYRLNIVPNNINDTITITDNGVDRTSQLVMEEGVDKDDNPVVSYLYELSNIQAAHTLLIIGASQNEALYVKLGSTWTSVSKIYRKENGSWVEKTLTYLSDNNIHNLIKGN